MKTFNSFTPSAQSNLCMFAATALLVYDILLTLDAEVELIWARKFSLVSVLYVINRYISVVARVPSLVLLFPMSNSEACKSLVRLSEVCLVLPYLSWACFSAFRVHALSDRNLALSVIVFVLTAAYILPDLYTNVHSSFIDMPYPYSCAQDVPPNRVLKPLLWTTRVAMVFGESIVIGLTLNVTCRMRPQYAQWNRSQSLAVVLRNNGIACFSIPVILNILVTALIVVRTDATVNISQIILYFRDSITSILVSHFILDLRALSGEKPTEDMANAHATWHFSSTVENVTFVIPDRHCGRVQGEGQYEEETAQDPHSVRGSY